jgi:hypothetical protein
MYNNTVVIVKLNTLEMMIYLANVLLLQNIDVSTLIIIGAVGFLLGFLAKSQEARKSSKSLFKLRKERDINRERISALKERIEMLEKKNSGLKKDDNKSDKN